MDGEAGRPSCVLAGGSPTNSQPVRLGGKDIGANNDQFHGYLDAAWVYIG